MHKINGPASNYREKRGKFPIGNREIQSFHRRVPPELSLSLSTLEFFIESMNSRSVPRAWINGHLLSPVDGEIAKVIRIFDTPKTTAIDRNRLRATCSLSFDR